MLSNEQAEQIKKQLLKQIESTFPDDKKEAARQQVDSMDSEQLEEFLEQNNLVQQKGTGQQCVFCSIVDGKIPSSKIGETDDAIAILEINPISKGHSLIIPKEHSAKIPKSVSLFAEKISKKIKSKLKPKKTEITPSELFGHKILNILPVYKDETFNSDRHPAKPEELEKIKSQLEEKQKAKTIKKSKPEKIEEKNMWLPKRIP